MDIGFGERWQNSVTRLLTRLFIACEAGNLEKLLKEPLLATNHILWSCSLEGKIKYKDPETNVIFSVFFFLSFLPEWLS